MSSLDLRYKMLCRNNEPYVYLIKDGKVNLKLTDGMNPYGCYLTNTAPHRSIQPIVTYEDGFVKIVMPQKYSNNLHDGVYVTEKDIDVSKINKVYIDYSLTATATSGNFRPQVLFKLYDRAISPINSGSVFTSEFTSYKTYSPPDGIFEERKLITLNISRSGEYAIGFVFRMFGTSNNATETFNLYNVYFE